MELGLVVYGLDILDSSFSINIRSIGNFWRLLIRAGICLGLRGVCELVGVSVGSLLREVVRGVLYVREVLVEDGRLVVNRNYNIG